MPQERYMANPSVSCLHTPRGTALLNPDTGERATINDVGRLIWEVLSRPRTLHQIVAHVVTACRDAPAEQVRADAGAFLATLEPRGFVGTVWPADRLLPEPAPAGPPAALPSQPSPLASDTDRRWVCHGGSMVPAFRPGDVVTIESKALTAIRPGDVVVYRGHGPSGEPTDVVHRVLSVTPDGLLTRGDSNPSADEGRVTQDALIGRVTHVERHGRLRRAPGGRWALLQLWARRLWGLFWRPIKATARPAYRWLRKSGLARRVWHPDVIPLLLTAGQATVKYVHRGRTVAWRQLHTGRFSCRRPYDLILLRPDGREFGTLAPVRRLKGQA